MDLTSGLQALRPPAQGRQGPRAERAAPSPGSDMGGPSVHASRHCCGGGLPKANPKLASEQLELQAQQDSTHMEGCHG
eukprot:899996-Alexandrium_andersonii.AAC.1